ncbi:UNVERIFIED_CONTAM: Cyclin-dependent kinase G-1 [Sesamum angustifolium]|uniref:Cyclin-dependent kinase G-1 n=1 Tax=Sesamum angustifolium TaxID=2727405 RepID=A0AAW2NHM4_9LAMI
MEHLDSDLKRLMDVKMQQLRPSEVKCMMKQLLEGIKFLHENEVMHRDLKPSNLLVNKMGELKICDFGFSRQLQSESGSYSPGVATLWYRAPEVLAGAETYSSAVDMWFLALGRTPMLTQLGFDLLNRLLRFDPDKRITTDEALNHGWFKEFEPYLFCFTKKLQLDTSVPRNKGEDYYQKMRSRQMRDDVSRVFLSN